MRIERLDLTAYGAFDGHSLEDLGAPGVHLVHGPNEAGKSTALSALDQLLYGIPHNSRYAFLHGARTRLGARLSAVGGVELEVIRRKRLKNALVNGDGAPLGQEDLAAFLGAVDRDTFTTEFALNGDELRRGGELLASGEGDMAQLLAAARSGMRLKAVLDTIETRQDRLFRSRGRTNPKINAALGRLKEARQKARETKLPPDQYRDAEQAVTEAEQRLEAATTELKRLQRLRDAKRQLREKLPALLQHHSLQEQIAEISAQGPVAPDDIREDLPELLKQQAEREAVTARDSRFLAGVDEQLAAAPNDESLLPHASTIDELTRDVAAILDAANRRDDASGEASRVRARAQAQLRTVHSHATLADEKLYRIPSALLHDGRKLRDASLKCDDDLNHARGAVQRWQDKREQADKKLSSLPALEDISQLQNAHAAVPADLPAKLVETEGEERKLDQRFRQTRDRLDLPETAPAEILHLRLPAREQVTEAEKAFSDLDRREREHAKDIDSEQRRLAACRRDLQRLVSDDAPPTREELRTLRAERDELLAGVLAGAGTGTPVVQQAVKRADDTVDLMLRHVEKVNQRVNLEHEIAELQATIPEHKAALAAVLVERDWARRSWDGLWKTWPAATPEISEATGLLIDVDKLKAEAQGLQDVRIDLAERREHLEAHTARLRRLLDLDDDPQVTTHARASAALAEVMETADGRLRAHEDVAVEVADARRDLANAETELAAAESVLARVQKAAADHDERRKQYLLDTGLPTDRDIDTALTDLENLLKAAADVETATEADQTALQATRRISEFRQRLEHTLQACGRNMPEPLAGWRQAVDTLAQDLRQQRADAQRRSDLLTNRAELAEAVGEAETELHELQTRLKGYCARLNVSSTDGLQAAADRGAELREKSTALANLQKTLPEGRELAHARREAERTSAEELETELAELDARILEAGDDQAHWLEQRTTRRDALGRLDGAGDAAAAEADIAAICAELAEDAEEFLRLETARIAILTCMEDYRNSDQEPVLAHASEVFTKLSLGRYTGLELSDEERPSIRARSSAGTLLAPKDLSEATRDQLYLALRLATLERHAIAGNALPIAVDDIFMTFDEPRTEAALRVLDAIADRFQVIVFTHHEHVIRSAVEELPSARCHVHRLPKPGSERAGSL